MTNSTTYALAPLPPAFRAGMTVLLLLAWDTDRPGHCHLQRHQFGRHVCPPRDPWIQGLERLANFKEQ